MSRHLKLIPLEYIVKSVDKEGCALLTPIGKTLSKTYKLDFGYTNALGRECCLILCGLDEL